MCTCPEVENGLSGVALYCIGQGGGGGNQRITRLVVVEPDVIRYCGRLWSEDGRRRKGGGRDCRGMS